MPIAPSCPTTISQIKRVHELVRGGPLDTRLVIPAAVDGDLPSLIRTVNAITDVLRSLTTSLTVNNVYNPRPPSFKAGSSKIYSDYPEWVQQYTQTVFGYVYHKDTKTLADGSKQVTMDKTQRAYVQRINQIQFVNKVQNDPDFIWDYVKPLDEQISV
jgi:hypothetical protein